MDLVEQFNHPRSMTEAQARIHELAIKRLIELENTIAEKHHRRLMCGIELEFNYRTKEGQIDTQKEVFKDAYKDVEDRNLKPMIRQNALACELVKACEKQGLGNFIEEFGTDRDSNEYQCYEFAISPRRTIENAEGEHVEALKKLYAPNEVASATHRLRATVQEHIPKIFPGMQAQFLALDPVNDAASAGLHVNLSLWDKNYEHSKLNELNPTAHVQMQKLLFPLLIESENNFGRFGSHDTCPAEFRVSDDKMGSSFNIRKSDKSISLHRFEDRLAASDTDPALATLLTVCGAYWSLEHQKQKVPLSGQVEMINDIPQTKEQYEIFLSAFEKSDVARQLLGNELHQELANLRRDQYNQIAASTPEKTAGAISPQGTLRSPNLSNHL